MHTCLLSSLYKTQAYLDEHLAIFHPAYVNKCLEEADIKKVAVGKYFMPPAEIQKGSLFSFSQILEGALCRAFSPTIICESTTGYTFTACVWYFTSPGIDTREKGPPTFSF